MKSNNFSLGAPSFSINKTLPLPILKKINFSFSILVVHKRRRGNSPELLSVEFIALLYPGGDLLATY